MKKWLQIISICFLLISTFFLYIPQKTEAVTSGPTAKQWANYKLNAKPPDDFTAEKINEVLKKKGQSDIAKNGNIGNAIYDAGMKNGVSPAIMFAMFVIETGWGKDELFILHNNPGGIKCKSGFECITMDRDKKQYTKFKSMLEGFQVKAELLATNYIGEGRDTLQKALEKYAPTSTGSDLYSEDGYIANIGKILKANFGMTPDVTEILKPDPNAGSGATYSDGTKVGSWKKYNFFMESTVYTNKTGVDSGKNELPAELSYSFQKFSDKTLKRFAVIGTVLSLGILVYIALLILAFTMVSKSPSKFRWSLLEKLLIFKSGTGSSKPYEVQLRNQVIISSLIGISMISIYFSGMYLRIIGKLYDFYEMIIGYLF